VTEAEEVHAAADGNAYNINTGDVSFSAAGTLIYVKNNEDRDLVIEALAVGVGNTGTHSDIGNITLVRNPTGGDLITDATAVSMNQNRDFGSNKTLTVDDYKGKSGGTLTGGNNIAQFYQGANGRLFADINLILPKGSSIGITYDPNLSSGSVNAYAAIICYLKDTASED
jgi:hypothetical protein